MRQVGQSHPKSKKYIYIKNKDCALWRQFWIFGQLVWGLEPAIGDGCLEDPIASRLDISGSEDSWIHTSHQLTDELKMNMNIIFKSNVRALKGLRVSPRNFQTSQICDTHAYFHHLITCANQKRIGSGNTRFFCFTCHAFKQPRQCLWCIIISSPGFFLWEKPWGRKVRVASHKRRVQSQRSCWVHRGLVLQWRWRAELRISHILELQNTYFDKPSFIKRTKQDDMKCKIIL